MTTMTAKQILGLSVLLVMVAAGAVFITAIPAQAGSDWDQVVDLALGNGVHATIHPAEYLAEKLVLSTGSSRGVIPLDDGRYLSVITDINDPLIYNKGDGRFHPFETGRVVELLREIDYPSFELDVRIYVLPFPRANLLVSSTNGTEVFLSPHVREISVESSAYIVAHELGHVFQYRYLPYDATRHWDQYRRIRDIKDRNKYSNSGPHPYRPVEIFAEDFRVLFGGPHAYYGGQVENPELLTPVSVAGLRDFFVSLSTAKLAMPYIVAVTSYPNPFNPQTEMRVELNDEFLAMGERMTVRIYDVRGALVRELYSQTPRTPEVHVRWDGRDRHGREVASSTYFGVVQAGRYKTTQKLIMVK